MGESDKPQERVIDLTKISVDLKLTFDQLDVVLLIATGGVGYLAKKAYDHFSGKAERLVAIQQKNFSDLLAEAEERGAKELILRVHPEVNVYAPNGGTVAVIESGGRYTQYKIVFGIKAKRLMKTK